MDKKLKQALEKMHYEPVGNHSAVSICTWTKKSLLNEGICYKQKFYGIRSHLCCQISPVLDCDQRCVFCWRPWEISFGKTNKWDSPKEIIDGCIAGQIRKLSGFGGNEKANLAKFEAAQEPMHFAVSLTGEPTLYPKLPELIKELHKRGKTSFLVTNGQHPEVLAKLKTKKALPTQLYVSIEAPTEELFKRIDQPLNKDAWRRINETLEMLPKLNCRKVLRLTMIKGLNDFGIKEWAKFIKKAGPAMLEIKAYMFIGGSRKRLKKENMPRHSEVKVFSKKLAKELGWKILDEKKESRVLLLAEKDFEGRIMTF